jgi:tRNA (guanine-N7-)-methyltransferase
MAVSHGSAPISLPNSATSPPDPAPSAAPAHRQRRFWGRHRGHRLSPSQQRLIDDVLPRLAVALDADRSLDPARLFVPAPVAVWLEIGFGGGEHLAAQAARHPAIGFIGCEPYINGVAQLLARIRDRQLGNVRVFADDAHRLLAALPERSLARIFLLFPDPWPKRRHHKRRFIRPETVAVFARLLAAGGELQVATDHPELGRWTLFHVLAHGDFAWPAQSAADWLRPPAGWVETRYEAKARTDGSAIYYLRFFRR